MTLNFLKLAAKLYIFFKVSMPLEYRAMQEVPSWTYTNTCTAAKFENYLTLQYSQYPHTEPFAYSTFSSSTLTSPVPSFDITKEIKMLKIRQINRVFSLGTMTASCEVRFSRVAPLYNFRLKWKLKYLDRSGTKLLKKLLKVSWLY